MSWSKCSKHKCSSVVATCASHQVASLDMSKRSFHPTVLFVLVLMEKWISSNAAAAVFYIDRAPGQNFRAQFQPPAPISTTPSPAPTPEQPTGSPTPGLSVAPSPAPPFGSCGICGDSYRAQIGDTLASIAAFCNVSLSLIQSLNPSYVGSHSLANEPISLPCTGSDPAGCGICGSFYIIKSGDILDDVATRCGMDISTLENANVGIDYNNIYPEQFVNIPCKGGRSLNPVSGCGICGISYTSGGNQTLQDVATACNLTLQQLEAINPAVESGGVIYPGQSVRIPCSGADPANCGPCGVLYNVTDIQDNLGAIAAKCHVGYVALMASNPSANFVMPPLGSLVRIPCKPSINPIVCSGCSPSFVVKQAATIETLASSCSVSPTVLSYANELGNTGLINAGTEILVPCIDPPKVYNSCSICGSSFTFQSVVDLVTIAMACNTTVPAIKAMNGNLSLDTLTVGDAVELPCSSNKIGCGPCGSAYVGVANDSLVSIAVKCTTFPSKIRALNPGIDFGQPLSGIVVTLPCFFSALSEPKSGSAATLKTHILSCHSFLGAILQQTLAALPLVYFLF
ncbi:hypothetical protein O6H91_16G052100 [Diphasiastrum complanatum]|uniref:Uncharacterized protein n=1 Tax=Diphasiastrum complanatum TaxID=34168 RepID=A0ACC2BC94_DIPCM|nr:hypothetical protein O6H91_16G052100 [Diphasiastrum complanatum]